jgi:hypothetical protein
VILARAREGRVRGGFEMNLKGGAMKRSKPKLKKTNQPNSKRLDPKVVAAATGSIDDIESVKAPAQAEDDAISSKVLVHIPVYSKPPRQQFFTLRGYRVLLGCLYDRRRNLDERHPRSHSRRRLIARWSREAAEGVCRHHPLPEGLPSARSSAG